MYHGDLSCDCHHCQYHRLSAALLGLALLVGVPFSVGECAGVDERVVEQTVTGKRFVSGREACYRLTFGTSDWCAQPEEYERLRIGDSVALRGTVGRVTGHLYIHGISNERSAR